MAITNDQFLQGLYIAYWGRPADPDGFYYWKAQQAELGFAGIAENFAASAEGQAAYAYFEAFYTYGADAITETMRGDFVEEIYQNLFNRAADADGKAYWIEQLESGASTPGAFIANIVNAAVVGAGADYDTLLNKTIAAESFTSLLVETGLDWDLALSSEVAAIIASVDGSSDMDVIDDAIEAAVEGGGSEGGFTLTNGVDEATANVFNAGRVWDPEGDDQMNSLQDDDVLTGSGANPTLNLNYVTDTQTGDYDISPTLNGIETINVAASHSAAVTLDLQDATGVKAVNITRMDANVTIDNITERLDKMSVSRSNEIGNVANFLFEDVALRGTADAGEVTLNNAQLGGLVIEEIGAADQGYETLNLVSAGSNNAVVQLQAEDLQTLNITGTADLALGGNNTVAVRAGTNTTEANLYTAGLNNVAGSLTKINAATFEGDLTLNLAGELNAGLDGTSGKAVQMEVLGGKGDDTFVLTQGTNIDAAATNTDKIDGGEGANELVLLGGAAQVIAAATAANLTKIQALEIRTGHDDAGVGGGGLGVGEVADVVTVDADAFDALATIYVRNEGQGSAAVGVAATGTNVSKVEVMTVNLNDLTAAQATGITLAHGTTGNSTIVNNVLNVAFKTAGTANAAQVTLVDGVNNNPVFNAQLSVASGELVTIVDSDTESNTVYLNQGAYTQAGSTITLQGGATGQYMNLDTVRNQLAAPQITAAVAAAATNNGYGQFTDGTAANNTTVLTTASAAAVAAGGIATRDAAASTVFYGTVGTADTATVLGDGFVRHTVESIVAGDYLGDVQIRLGDVTRADGVSSQRITTGVGNDTFIFDAVTATNAGFTSGDTITAGTGTDTLVLDGNTALIPGTPRINHQTSEWDNLSGIDVLRFGNNAGVANVANGVAATQANGVVANAGGAYYARIDNDFVRQADAGNRLTIINNDGDLTNITESDLVLDLRGLSQDKWVTFVGANSNGVNGLSSNRLVLDDISANQNMILNGGDTDVRVSTTGGYVAGNNNVYEVSNTANVSISDLSQTSNFGLINFTNDQAVAQTLTLTLNNTIVEALVDSSNTATSAVTQEILRVVATDNGAVASALNIDARAVTGFHSLAVTGSSIVTTGNDVLMLNSNVGGSVNFVDLGATSLGDRVNWTGGSATTTLTIDMGNSAISAVGAAVTTVAGDGFAQFVDGAVTTTHDINNAEIIDISGLTYLSSVINGDNVAVAETIIGGAGADVITGGAGADVLTGGTGIDNFVYAAGSTSSFTAETFAGTTWVNNTTAATTAIVAGETVTGAEVINDIATLDTITTGNAALIVDAGTLNMIENNEFVIVQGTYVAATGVFTVGAGLNTGADSLMIFDADGAATIDFQAVVLVGVTNAEELAIGNAAGVLTF